MPFAAIGAAAAGIATAAGASAAVAAGIGAVGSLAGAGLSAAFSGGGGGGVGGSGSAGAGNGQLAGNSNPALNDSSNAIYGVHVSSQATNMGQKAPNPKELTAPKAVAATAANPRSTPTQAQGSEYASKDFQGVWADRLSKYLDYNTRGLG